MLDLKTHAQYIGGVARHFYLMVGADQGIEFERNRFDFVYDFSVAQDTVKIFGVRGL